MTTLLPVSQLPPGWGQPQTWEKTPELGGLGPWASLGLASRRTRTAPAPGLRRVSPLPSRTSVGPAPTTRSCAPTAKARTGPQAPSRTLSLASADQQSPGTCPHALLNAPCAPACAPPQHSSPPAGARAGRSDGDVHGLARPRCASLSASRGAPLSRPQMGRRQGLPAKVTLAQVSQALRQLPKAGKRPATSLQAPGSGFLGSSGRRTSQVPEPAARQA